MATRTKEDNELLSSLQYVLGKVEDAQILAGAAMKTEPKWRSSKAASAYKKALQDAEAKMEQAETVLRNVARVLY